MAHRGDGLRPEGLDAPAPGALEDLGQQQHGHVAAQAVALAGDALQLDDHRLLQLRLGVVQLQRVGPAVEVRVAPMGQDQRAALAAMTPPVLRRLLQLGRAAGDEELRVRIHPRVVQRHVVGHEVEHQPQAASAQPLAQPRQCRIAAQGRMHAVAADGEAGAGDVFFVQVGKRALELAPPVALAARHALPRRPGLPDAEQPDPVEALLGQAVELGVAEVVERGGTAERARQLGQPQTGVDLVESGIAWRCHRLQPPVSKPGYSVMPPSMNNVVPTM